MSVEGDLIVGKNGTGRLYVQDGSRLNIKGDLISGQEDSSLDNIIDINSSYYSETNIDVDGKVIIGDAGKSKLIIKNGYIIADDSFVIGNKAGSQGSVLIEGITARAFASSGTRMDVGYAGEGNLTILDGIAGADLVVIGTLATGNGIVNITGKGKDQTGSASLSADNLIIGDAGIGVVNVSGLDDGDGTAYGSNLESGILGNKEGSQGTLNLDDSAFEVEGDLVVGNQGSGTLNAKNSAVLEVGNIIRSKNSTDSKVIFDSASIAIFKAENNFFEGFDSSTPIELKTGGLILGTYNVDITVNPDAILIGDVGFVDFESPKGGFAKAGTGTLTMSSNSKQWTGETLITEGVLKINGDYIMATNESLGIALDVQDEGSLISYGKLLVNGNADISNGALKVYASEAIANMTGNNEWKHIVKATTRTGEFKTVSDNNPLVSFYADYTDANAVHLKMGTPPVVTPPVVTPPVVTPPVVTPPVVTPPVVTPPVVTPPIVTPPVVTPPVVTPPVVTPPVVTPPVVTPPVVTPPVVTPPVVTPPVVIDTTFVESVNRQRNRNDVRIAAVLDRAITDRVVTGNNALADQLIKSTTNFNQAQLAAAANQLQPLFTGAANRIITDANYAVSEAVSERKPDTLERNLWAKLVGSNSSHDADDGVTGYDSDNYGAIIGLDLPINNDLNLGVAVSYIESDADTKDSLLDHELEAKSWQVLGYGRYDINGATNLNFHAGAGSSDVEGKRHIQILTNAIADSDYSVDTLQAGLGVTHRLGTDLRNITPFAQVNYAHAKSDSYRETGAGVYNLNVDDNKYESMRWTVGLDMSQALSPTFALTGKLAAAIENGDQRSDISASFIGMRNDEFRTAGPEADNEIGIVGVGFSYTPTSAIKISAGYRGEWRENYDDQGGAISLQTTF